MSCFTLYIRSITPRELIPERNANTLNNNGSLNFGRCGSYIQIRGNHATRHANVRSKMIPPARRVHKKCIYISISGIRGHFSLFPPISLSLLASSKTADDTQGCQEHLCYLTTYCPFVDVLRGRDDDPALPSPGQWRRTCQNASMCHGTAVPALLQPLFFVLAVSDGIDILARARGVNIRSARINLLPEPPLSDDDGGLWYGTISGRDRFCKFLSSRYILSATKLLYLSLRNA